MIEDSCPEYTLVTDKVVLVIVGSRPANLCRWRKPSIFVSRTKNLRFAWTTPQGIKILDQGDDIALAMDLVQQHIEQELTAPPHTPVDTSLARGPAVAASGSGHASS